MKQFFKFAPAFAISLAISACSHIPIATLAKMATTDTDNLNPAYGRYAFRIPNNTKLPNGFPFVRARFAPTNPIKFPDQKFNLSKVESPLQSKHLLSDPRKGHHFVVYEFSPDDKQAAIELFDQINNLRVLKNKKIQGSLNVEFQLCKLPNETINSQLANVYWRLKPEEDFFTMLENVNFIELYNQSSKSQIKTLANCN